ncbi:hypothetical protein IIY68_00740 [Candidatus Saccharibacteria bacterium]|nr:hypothetical protein [Candidatus Saccharibacteria bacterium]
MRSSESRKFSVIGFIVCLIVSFVLNIGQANASAPETAIKKFEAYGLYNCMTSRFERDFTQEYVADSSNNYIKNLIKSSYLGGVPLWNGALGQTDDDYVSLPAGHNLSNANDDKISCVHLAWNLVGSSNNENPYDSFGALLDKFGYNKENATAGSSAKCVEYNFSIANGDPSQFSDSGKITYCESSVKENGTIDITNSNPRITISSGDYHIGHIDTNDASKITYCFNNFQPWFEKCSDISDDEIAESVSRNQPWSKVTNELGTSIRNLIQSYHNKYYSDMGFSTAAINTGGGYWVKYNGMENGQSDSNDLQDMYNYKLNPSDGFKKAYQNFFGSNFESLGASYGFSKSQQAALYSNYIQSYWKADTQACADTAEASKSAAGDLAIGNDDDDIGQFYHQTKLYKSDGAAQYCYVKATENQGDKVYGLADNVVGGTLNFPANSKISFVEVAKWLLDNGPDSIDPEDIATSTTSNTDGTNGEVEPTCMSRAGTSLGWILCPVLDAFGGATDWAYNKLVEPALEIEPQLFTGEGDNTRDAWRTFRDIANIFFIILFLVVIFSQLTGVGIDNYGIKKILPKLIVAAVLINLSYIICVVFIDLSNILGNGLRNIFTRLGSQLTIPDSIEGIKIGDVAGGALTAITVLIALVGGVAVAITAAGGVVAFLVSLLVVALSAIIALFFLFLLLAAREAAIVVLTVLSPLAFACYILPNTQNIFKKWYQLGWRLLMVYPIAGLLIGGGDYVSKLLLSAGTGSEGFFSAFTAMIAGIVPIFFIPTVLKQSFALMGGLGAKIAGFGKSMGSRVSGNLDKSVRGGERFKNYQADRERNRKLRYARRTNRNLSDRLDNGETLSQRQRDRLARARMVESAEYSDELKRRAIVDGNRYETMRAGIEAKSRDEAINDRLALMQKNGVNGGAYSLENMYARMQNLEKASRTQALTDDEKGEMAALARGMASRQGGASMLNSIIRSAGSDGKSNSNFMSAMGEIYGNDSAVASKMAEKDAGASAFTEKFMPNGAGYDGDFAAYQGTKEYKDAIDKRIKSYSAGLNQGGAAVTDYVNSLDKSDLQAIIDNEGLYNSLDTDVRRAIDERTGSGPKGLNIQRTARQVEIAGENQVFDVHGLDSDTLLDIATNPKISDNDPNRAAAVEELNKRGIK